MKKFYVYVKGRKGFPEGRKASIELDASQQTLRFIFIQSNGTENNRDRIMIKEFINDIELLLIKKYEMKEV